MAKTKEILIVAPGGEQGKGGIGRLIKSYTTRLVSNEDIKFRVIDSYGPAPITFHDKVKMPFRFFYAVVQVVLGCMSSRAGLVHVHMATYGSALRKSIVIVICRSFNIPALLHLHGGDLEQFCLDLGAFKLRIFKRIITCVEGVVVLGQIWKRVAADSLGVPSRKITVLYNAVEGPGLPPCSPVGGVCNLLFLGTLSEKKGVFELLSALAEPQLVGRPWALTIAGKGPSEPVYKEAEKLGLAQQITISGWVDEEDVQRLLAKADILVLPSHAEGLSLAVLEGMAFGLGVITTPVGATSEVITDGKTGILVPVSNIKALASAILRLVNDPVLRHKLGQAAHDRFCREFNIDQYSQEIRDLYLKYLK